MGLAYQLVIRNQADDGDELVISSLASDAHPYIAENGIPEGDGQTLDPVTGKVTVGAFRGKVIDVETDVETEVERWRQDWGDYADTAAFLAAWTETSNPGGRATWDLDPSHVVSSPTAAHLHLVGTVSVGEEYRRELVIPGFTPGQAVTFKRELWASGGTVPTGVFFEASTALTADGSGNVTVYIRIVIVTAGTVDWHIWFDNLRVVATTGTFSRIVTAALTDANAQQQLLSRRAFWKESENEGASWDVLIAGYVNSLRLEDAMLYEFTVGESRRVEQTTKVFERIEDGFDRVSCLVGGPVIGGFGPIIDKRRPRFQVVDTTSFPGIVFLQWTGGALFLFDRNVVEFLNGLARGYLGDFDNGTGQPFPNLRVRLMDIETGPDITSNPPTGTHASQVGTIALTADQQDFVPVAVYGGGLNLPGQNNAYNLLSDTNTLGIRWPASAGPVPVVGERFKLVVFPEEISERNPLHWRGHPMDLATGLLTLRGESYNAASAAAVRTALGDDLEIEIRPTGPRTLADALESLVYGPFGVAARTNDAGEREFFTTRRRPDSAPVETLTVDDLNDEAGDGAAGGVPWELEEGTAINKVLLRTQIFTVADGRDTEGPIDYLVRSTATYDAVPDESGGAVFGSQTITYEIPGRILTVDPVEFTARIGAEVFDFQGRGAITSELAIIRGRSTAKIGEEVVLDMVHLPTASVGQVPTSQRGTVARVAMVLRRTPTPAGPVLKLQDRGIADAVALVPTFTIAASGTEPRKVATVTITNGAAFPTGVRLAVEMATGSSMPTSGRAVRVLNPATDALTFDLPAVDAGAKVWARLRAEKAGQRPSAWSAFAGVQLDVLDPPTSFAGTVSGTFVDLTWVVGETDIPLEVLWKAAADTTYESVALLPAGSTSYRLTLPAGATSYTIAVRHREAAPFAGVSTMATITKTTGAAPTLNPPINPAVFAGHLVDGLVVVDGTYGLEVTATEFPSDVEVWEAIEAGIGSGTAGTYTAIARAASVSSGRTRFTATPAPNDGLRRFLKARHVREGATASSFTTPLSVLPWSVVALPGLAPVLQADVGAAATVVYFQLGEVNNSIRIAASTAGEPSDATVRAAAAVNGTPHAGSTTIALAVTPGETVTIKAFGYTGPGGAGTESEKALLTVLYGGADSASFLTAELETGLPTSRQVLADPALPGVVVTDVPGSQQFLLGIDSSAFDDPGETAGGAPLCTNLDFHAAASIQDEIVLHSALTESDGELRPVFDTTGYAEVRWMLQQHPDDPTGPAGSFLLARCRPKTSTDEADFRVLGVVAGPVIALDQVAGPARWSEWVKLAPESLGDMEFQRLDQGGDDLSTVPFKQCRLQFRRAQPGEDEPSETPEPPGQGDLIAHFLGDRGNAVEVFDDPCDPGFVVPVIAKAVTWIDFGCVTDTVPFGGGTGIQSADDLSGHGNGLVDAGNGTYPTWITDTFAGKVADFIVAEMYFPAGMLDGLPNAQLFMLAKGYAGDPAPAGAALNDNHYMSWKLGAAPHDPIWAGQDNVGHIVQFIGGNTGAGHIWEDFGSNARHDMGDPATPLNDWVLYVVDAKSTYRAWINDDLLYSAGGNTYGANPIPRLGAGGTATPREGVSSLGIAAIAIYTGLTDGEIDTVKAAMRESRGLATGGGSGGTLTRWQDQSGYEHDAVLAGGDMAPTAADDEVVMTGGARLTLPEALRAMMASSAAVELYAAVEAAADPNSGQNNIWQLGPQDSDYPNSAGEIVEGAGRAVAASAGNPSLSLTAYRLYHVRVTEAAVQILLDRTVLATFGAGTMTWAGTLRIGGGVTFREIRIYGRRQLHTDGERDTIYGEMVAQSPAIGVEPPTAPPPGTALPPIAGIVGYYAELQYTHVLTTPPYTGIYGTVLLWPPSGLEAKLDYLAANNIKAFPYFLGNAQLQPSGNGSFSYAFGKQNLQTYGPYRSLIQDAYDANILVGCLTHDDIDLVRRWGAPIPSSTLDAEARDIKEVLQFNIRCFVRAGPTTLEGRRYPFVYIDGCVAQFDGPLLGSRIPIGTYITREEAAAARLHKRLVYGGNLVNGGDGSSGILGSEIALRPGQRVSYFQSAADILRDNVAMAQRVAAGAADFFVTWMRDWPTQDDKPYTQHADILAANQAVLDILIP